MKNLSITNPNVLVILVSELQLSGKSYKWCQLTVLLFHPLLANNALIYVLKEESKYMRISYSTVHSFHNIYANLVVQSTSPVQWLYTTFSYYSCPNINSSENWFTKHLDPSEQKCLKYEPHLKHFYFLQNLLLTPFAHRSRYFTWNNQSSSILSLSFPIAFS